MPLYGWGTVLFLWTICGIKLVSHGATDTETYTNFFYARNTQKTDIYIKKYIDILRIIIYDS
jgi:hypothetical protein